ncbi:hypothetical protein B0H14DRAFT_3884236 [Mycena olivaceomarginata]|nr:hypothetical protein B0H14DRAFT_3884236 [Mycena olivaceomarginata]
MPPTRDAQEQVRLTIKKKSNKGRVALGREKNAPTAEEWAGMPQYYTPSRVEDEDGMGHDFSVNDLARILPHKREVSDVIETHEYWVCKIVDVRARSDTDVWVSIEWFYSPQDAVELNKEYPDTGASVQLPLIESASAEPAKKRRRASSHARVPNTTISSPAAFRPLLAALPPVLVRAAAQPMVRGGVLGVAGNTAAVVAARRTVCAALRDGTFGEGWEKRMPEGWEQTMPEGWDAEDVLLVGGRLSARMA